MAAVRVRRSARIHRCRASRGRRQASSGALLRRLGPHAPDRGCGPTHTGPVLQNFRGTYYSINF